MKITVIGSGYVGLVTAACFAEVGHNVLCLDLDAKKIEDLNQGIIPIHEPGLDDFIKRNMIAGRISFTTDIQLAAEYGDVQFIAVGTPPGEDGSADLSHVLSAAENIGRYMNRYTVVVDKSTVPVGTADKVRKTIESAFFTQRGEPASFDVVSNPEFLKEGAAIDDFMRPDRVVIGTDSSRALEVMTELYNSFGFGRDKVLSMDIRSAELTKYAANAMLATKISFINELTSLCEKTGADITAIRKGMGTDRRIGMDFLHAGPGYGGSCFPKDVKALIHTGHEYGVDLPILDSVEEVNERQKLVLAQKVITHFGDIVGMKFAIWGLAFKPNTDDMREAPSTSVIRELVKRGATAVCYDPVAYKEGMKIYKDEPAVSFARDAMRALADVDGLIIVTEWKEFRGMDLNEMRKRMKKPVIFDGRNIYKDVNTPRKHGFLYFSIGRQ